jgi:hypothetical protein
MNPFLRSIWVVALFCLFTKIAHADISVLVLTGQVAPGVENAQFSSLGKPSINSSGEIAFHAGLSNGSEGIFRSSQGRISLIALKGQSIGASSQLIFGTMGDPVINDSGNVALIASVQGGANQLQAVFVISDTGISTVLDTTTPIPGIDKEIYLIRNLHFNNRGDIAVYANLLGADGSGTGGEGILLKTSGGYTLLSGDVASFSLNNAGEIAFLGSDGAIYLFSGSMTQLVAQSGQTIPNTDLTLNTLQNPYLNDEGGVVFVNGFTAGTFIPYFSPTSIVKWRGGFLEKVAAIGDTVPGLGTATLFSNFSSPLSQNSGKVFFIARYSTGSTTTNAIFSNDGVNLSLLVQEGQSLEGVGTFTFIGKPAVNDSGTLIFVSNLGSGSSGIFRLDTSMNELYFPRVADGSFGNQWAWRTTLILSNQDSSGAANIVVNFLNEDGSPMTLAIQNLNGSQFSFVIPARGSLELETEGIGEVKTGWAKVQSDKKLSGIAIFSYYDGAGNYISEVGVPATSRESAFSLFVESRSDTNTAIVLTNPNASPASASLTLRDEQGNSLSTVADLPVPPSGEIAKYVTDLFQGVIPPDFHGTVEVVDQLPILGLTLRQRKDVFTWLPLIQ